MTKMMKVLAVVAVMGLVAPAFAAKGDKPKKGEKPLVGKVVSVTAPETGKDGKLVLATKEAGQKVEKEITITTTTKLMVNNEDTTDWSKVETGLMAKVVQADNKAMTVQVMPKGEKKGKDENKPKKPKKNQ